MYFFVVRLLGLIAWVLFPIHFSGIENIPQKGKLIICCNHKSVIDPLLLMMRFTRKIYFMAKTELFMDHGILAGWLLRKMGAFPVHRNSGDTHSIKNALAVLAKENVLGIFPQGGCVYDDTQFVPKAGIGLIIAKSHADVLPVCIYSKGRIRPFKPIFVSFGEVISYGSFGFKKGTTKECRFATEIIAANVCTLLERNDSTLQK